MFRFLVLFGFLCALSLSNEAVLKNFQFFPRISQFFKPPFIIDKVVSANDQQCNLQKFHSCNVKLAEKTNMTSLPRTESTFAAILNAQIQTEGLAGFETVCKNFDIYKACVGPEYDSCTTVDNLQNNMHLTKDDAQAYSSLAQVIQYECGPGAYDVIVGHWSCIIAQLNLQQEVLIGCVNQYVAQLEQNYTNICQYTQQYTDCYIDAINDCEADVELVMCQAMEIAFSVSLPQCKINCPNGD